VGTQLGAKYQFSCTALNKNCEAQRVSKNETM
jgi:hypothetical protein